MGHYKSNNPNCMEEMRQVQWGIDKLKPEPEICNVSCPPFGCPLYPRMCCLNGICNPYCDSKMPKNSHLPSCPALSDPSRSYSPSLCGIASCSSNHLHHTHSGQNSTPPIQSTSNQIKQITSHHQSTFQSIDHQNLDSSSTAFVCQVPSTNHYNQLHGATPFTSPHSNFNSTQQSYPDTIKVCYPPIHPPTFTARSPISSTRSTDQQIYSSPCPPPYNRPQFHHQQQIHHNNPEFSVRQYQLPSQQSCPTNSTYVVSIPHR